MTWFAHSRRRPVVVVDPVPADRVVVRLADLEAVLGRQRRDYWNLSPGERETFWRLHDLLPPFPSCVHVKVRTRPDQWTPVDEVPR